MIIKSCNADTFLVVSMFPEFVAIIESFRYGSYTMYTS